MKKSQKLLAYNGGRKNHARKSLSERIVFVAAFIILVLYAAFVLYFFAFGLNIALLGDQAAFTDALNSGTLINFDFSRMKLDALLNSFRALPEAMQSIDSSYEGLTFFTLVWNSIWRTVLYSGLSIFSSAIVCYILVFYRSRLTKFLYNLGLFVSIIPVYGTAAATFALYTDFMGFDLRNNPILIIITSVALYGGYFFYMYSFFKSLSWEYAEAAFVDGANHYKVFFKIMLPMALPSIAALFIMSFITGWNDYESTMLYMGGRPNLSYAVYFIGEYNPGDVPAYMAGVIISLIPMLVLFSLFQNTIMEKVHLGGLKG